MHAILVFVFLFFVFVHKIQIENMHKTLDRFNHVQSPICARVNNISYRTQEKEMKHLTAQLIIRID